MTSDESGAEPRLARLLLRVAAGLASFTGVGMVLGGLAGEFQLGSDDYAHWEQHRWAPILWCGGVGWVLALAAGGLVTRRRVRLRVTAAVVGAATILMGIGAVQWHQRTDLRGSFRAAFDRLDLGPGFAKQTLRYDVYSFNDGYEAPDAVQTWRVSAPVARGCRSAALAAGAWSGLPNLAVFTDRADQPCVFATAYSRFRVSFTWVRSTPDAWILSAEMDAAD